MGERCPNVAGSVFVTKRTLLHGRRPPLGFYWLFASAAHVSHWEHQQTGCTAGVGRGMGLVSVSTAFPRLLKEKHSRAYVDLQGKSSYGM